MSDDERDIIRVMWEDGKPTDEIARVVNYTPATVRRVAKEMGLTVRPHGGGHGRGVTDDQIREMREMRRKGATYIEIGNAFGINDGLVWHYINKSKIGGE